MPSLVLATNLAGKSIGCVCSCAAWMGAGSRGSKPSNLPTPAGDRIAVELWRKRKREREREKKESKSEQKRRAKLESSRKYPQRGSVKRSATDEIPSNKSDTGSFCSTDVPWNMRFVASSDFLRSRVVLYNSGVPKKYHNCKTLQAERGNMAIKWLYPLLPRYLVPENGIWCADADLALAPMGVRATWVPTGGGADNRPRRSRKQSKLETSGKRH